MGWLDAIGDGGSLPRILRFRRGEDLAILSRRL